MHWPHDSQVKQHLGLSNTCILSLATVPKSTFNMLRPQGYVLMNLPGCQNHLFSTTCGVTSDTLTSDTGKRGPGAA